MQHILPTTLPRAGVDTVMFAAVAAVDHSFDYLEVMPYILRIEGSFEIAAPVGVKCNLAVMPSISGMVAAWGVFVGANAPALDMVATNQDCMTASPN